MISIRRRLIVSLALGLLLLFAIGGTAVYQVVRTRVHDAFDQGLASRAQSLAAALSVEIDRPDRHAATQLGLVASPGSVATDDERRAAREALLELARRAFRIRLGLDLEGLPEYQAGDDAAYFTIRGGAPDARIAASPSLPETASGLTGGTGALPDGRAGKASTLTTTVRFRDRRWDETWAAIVGDAPDPMTSATITVARGVEQRDGYLRTLRDGLILTGALLVLGVALVTWFVVRRGLSPLAALSQQVAALDATSLDTRLPDDGLPGELQPIVQRLNEALDRIAVSVGRERQTAANIAHELRTPLAELTTITELAVRWPEDAEITARAAKDGHAVAQHMTRVVSALLKVARADAGQAPIPAEPFDLVPVVGDAWRGLDAAATERSQQLERHLPEHLEALSDREVTEAVVASLLGNAVQHAPAGSTIQCRGSVQSGTTRLSIENPAPDLSADDVEQVRGLFWRKDDARTPSTHTGLGLSVTAALAASAGIRVEPALEAGVFRVTLSFAAA